MKFQNYHEISYIQFHLSRFIISIHNFKLVMIKSLNQHNRFEIYIPQGKKRLVKVFEISRLKYFSFLYETSFCQVLLHHALNYQQLNDIQLRIL